MLLYATTTSERASKGQGGKFLDISITNKDGVELWKLQVRDYEDFYELRMHNRTRLYADHTDVIAHGSLKPLKIVKTKGEKQKGKVKPYKCACGRINDTEKCDECGYNH